MTDRRCSGASTRSRAPWTVLLVLVCVAALLAPGVAAAQTTGPADLPDAMPGDRVLVSHRTATSTELHLVTPDGSGRTVLTTGAHDFAGAWSPDGRRVAFHRVEAGGDGLWVVPSAGGPAQRLADGGHSPSWSPDGASVVHSPSTEADPQPLQATRLDGTSSPVPGSEGGIDPVWSPDGRRIAYVDPLADFAVALRRVDGSGGEVASGPASEPTWSPAGDVLAFIERRDDGPRLVLLDVAAGTTSVLVGQQFARMQQLAYSPDGTHVAFAASVAGGDLDIWIARIADGHLRQLTDTPDDEFSPTWTAGADVVAFTGTSDIAAEDAARDVFWVGAEGGAVQRVTDTGADDVVSFAPGLTLRLSGIDRVGTALALSRTIPSAEAVVIARADAYPDALAGAPLASALEAPILLTGGDRLHPALPAELERLGAETAYLLGGSGALSPQVEEDLAAAGVDEIRRLAGTDRFGTALAIADELETLAGEPGRVFVVEGLHADPGRGWPDAVSASGLAAATGEPILLTLRDRLPAATASGLEARASARATVVGGTAAVSQEVAAAIDERTAEVDRIAGTDRYGTSVRVAEQAAAAGADAAHPWLVTGRDWPDALVAAPIAARDGGVLLLVDGRDPAGSAASHAWLADRPARRGVVVGGGAAISPLVRAALERSLARAH